MLVKTNNNHTKTSLQEIVNGVIDNQQWAQVALYDHFFLPAYHSAYRILKNKMSAEDAVHEGFIKAFDKISSLKNPEVIEGWLKRIIINEALQFVKKEKFYSDPILDDKMETIESDLNTSEIPLNELFKCIEELPEGYRVICQLHLVEEMKHDEIANSLGISTSTSRSQLTRAKVKLRKIINDKGILK